MKKATKMMVLASALVVSLSMGAGSTADAATKVKVKNVKVTVDTVNGSAASKKSITLTKGKKATIKATVSVTPNKSKYKKVTYKTNKKSVATVSSKGVITAKGTGKAKITVTSKKNSKKKAYVNVTVVSGKVTKVAIAETEATLKVGNSQKFTAKVSTKGKKASKTLKWTSSDKSVATVDSKGNVKAIKAGTATITATAADGTKKKDSVKITVEDYKTVIAPKSGDVEVTVAFKDAKAVQKDVDTLAKVAVQKGADVEVYLDGTKYVATFDGTNVKINGKLISDSAKANNAKTVKVKVNVKADKIAAVTAFAPASVASVTYGDVTFTEITEKSFKVGDKTYTYTVEGKNIVVDGNVKADFAKLETVVDITVK